ncbi:MAG: hydantoinase/oxoprolinase family protein [Candidatus Acidiferrales bacterium]
MRIAIDTGGTFTDCVYLSDGAIRVLKVFSTPQDPGEAILGALREISPDPHAEIRHGTTVGTNTLLERKGARVAFVTTAGFEDVIAIGRQARPKLYDWFVTPAPPLADEEMRFGVKERTLYDGKRLEVPEASELEHLVEKIRESNADSIAVSLLFSFANSSNEKSVVAALEKIGLPISASHEILPEFREYERGSTIVVNAYLAPKMGHYLGRLNSALASVCSDAKLHVMQSSGGIASAAVAAREPVRTILSGPAGGVVGACAVARLAGFSQIIPFDMGGTSTDVALVNGADSRALSITNESQITGIPVAVPTLDIHTVGAGGGSLASFDSGGVLRVGPESAGADPGPICYGRGTQPTVTDANLVLGRLDPEFFLGGKLVLDGGRARDAFEGSKGAIESVEIFADGIVRLAEATMEKALRRISVERGYDPREFTLVSFGGAGPLHACALARSLRIPRVLVPCFPGALSALGILMSDMSRDFSKTVMLPLDHPDIEGHFRNLERRGREEMKAENLAGVALRSLDIRYVGQGYELNIEAGKNLGARFHAAHQRRYGYSDATRPVEVVNLRVRTVARTRPIRFPREKLRRGDGKKAILKKKPVYFDGKVHSSPVYDRSRLAPGDRFAGPAIVTEYSATSVIPPLCRVQVDQWSNLVIEVNAGRRVGR